jgi:exodeoxyribonuclease VII small subunit
MTDDRPDDRAAWDSMTFEELMAALEQLTEQMASGEIGIEEAADLYEQAEQLHSRAAERLASVQARIEALAAKDAKPNARSS